MFLSYQDLKNSQIKFSQSNFVHDAQTEID